MNQILKHGDTRELLKKLPDNCIDCLFTDPPYKVVKGGCGETSGFEVDEEMFNSASNLFT